MKFSRFSPRLSFLVGGLVFLLGLVVASKAADTVRVSAQATTPTPAPSGPLQGDVDCNASVNAIDAVKVLRYSIGLSVTQAAGCTAIGAGGPPVLGNVDCLGAEPVDPVDALKILRYVAGLSVAQSEPCQDIGT